LEIDICNCFIGEKFALRNTHHVGNTKLNVLHTTTICTVVPKHDAVSLHHWTRISQILFLLHPFKAFRSLIYGTMQVQKNCHHHHASNNVLPKLGLGQVSSNSSKTISSCGQQKNLHQFWTHHQHSGILWHKAICSRLLTLEAMVRSRPASSWERWEAIPRSMPEEQSLLCPGSS